jgi:hypothetical protein
MISPTHVSNGSIVVSVDTLSAEDLRALLDLKLSEPKRQRAREDEELGHRELSTEIAWTLSDANPGLILAEYFDAFLLAAVGPASLEAMGHYPSAASVTA